MLNKFEGIDKSCKTTERKFFPYSGEIKDFFIIINKGQDYIKPEIEPLRINFKKIKGVPHFKLDTELKDEHGKIFKVRDVKEKTVVFCPFCNHQDRGNPDQHNASIELNKTGEPSIYCASCESRGNGISGSGVYTLDNNEAFQAQSKKLEVPVFRDILSDKYFIGDTSKRTGVFEYHSIAKMNIPNALKNRDMAIPDKYPEVEFDYDFADRIRYDMKKGFVNRYVAPDLLLAEPNKNVFCCSSLHKEGNAAHSRQQPGSI